YRPVPPAGFPPARAPSAAAQRSRPGPLPPPPSPPAPPPPPPSLLTPPHPPLPLPTLLSLTLVSHALRAFVLSPTCEGLWLAAAQEMGLPRREEMEVPMRGVELAWLVGGKWCRMCHKNNARKVDYNLRVRLCSKCWDEHIVYEGPDEPDPAFEAYFPGTKRYTPRSVMGKSWKKRKVFFFAPSLASTSLFLSSLLAPQVSSYTLACSTFSPSASLDEPDLDDYLAPSALPPATQRALEERAEWVRGLRRDGGRLGEWEGGWRERERTERREEREREKREGEGVAREGEGEVEEEGPEGGQVGGAAA
ncbi:hypothetical protein JCM6882_001230, partial [Rhodosporidiobolus microsporus]